MFSAIKLILNIVFVHKLVCRKLILNFIIFDYKFKFVFKSWEILPVIRNDPKTLHNTDLRQPCSLVEKVFFTCTLFKILYLAKNTLDRFLVESVLFSYLKYF